MELWSGSYADLYLRAGCLFKGVLYILGGFYGDLELQPCQILQPFLEAVPDYIDLGKYCMASLYLSLSSLSLSPSSLSLSVSVSLFLSFSLATGSEYDRKSFDPKAAGLEGLEWDSAELFRVSQLQL